MNGAEVLRESPLFVGDTEQASELAAKVIRAGFTGRKLGILGHDDKVVETFAKKLYAVAVVQGDHTPLRERHRGRWFEVQLPTGHVVQVVIEFDRLEQ